MHQNLIVHALFCHTLLTKVCRTIFLHIIHTFFVHYSQDAANLISGYSKYAKVARLHDFSTISLRTLYARLRVAYGAFTGA